VKLSNSIFLSVLSLSSLFVQQDAKANLFRINVDESGGDVVFSFNGSIDTTGASLTEATDINGNPFTQTFAIRNRFNPGAVSPNIEFMGRDHIGAGDDFASSAYRWEFSPSSIKVPAFGTNNFTYSGNTSGGGYIVKGSGDFLRIQANHVYLPTSFSSGDTVTGSMTFENTTLNDLSITPGTYSYTLGNNNMEIVATPGPLPILGLPVIFLYYKGLKDKSKYSGGTKLAPIGASNSKL